MNHPARVRFRFPKSSRLRLRSEFTLVKSEGQSWTGRYCTLAVLRRDGETGARIGIITTRRVGNAVTRNKIRRRFREIFRRHQHSLIQGIWLVTIARFSAASAAYADMERDWLRLAGRASILAPV